MEIGLFQLENLFLNRNQYWLFDFRIKCEAEKAKPLPAVLSAILKAALVLKSEEVVPYISEKKISKEFPLIFLCDDGTHSLSLAQELEHRGHSNVYAVGGGMDGLLSEL